MGHFKSFLKSMKDRSNSCTPLRLHKREIWGCSKKHKKHQPLRFCDLPKDIIFTIFELLRDTNAPRTATCLSLTTKSLYLVLKTFFPDPISLDSKDMMYWYPYLMPYQKSLEKLLVRDDFFPPNYRGFHFQQIDQIPRPPPIYLNLDHYGAGENWKYTAFQFINMRRDFYSSDDGHGKRILLNPCGYVGDWYVEAEQAYCAFKEKSHPDKLNSSSLRWQKWWESTFAYGELCRRKSQISLMEYLRSIQFNAGRAL